MKTLTLLIYNIILLFFVSISFVFPQNRSIDEYSSAFNRVTQHLSKYDSHYPTIKFLLYHDDSKLLNLDNLLLQLGNGATNLDYEHSEQDRELLMQVQLSRIALMLENNMPSSTLFKTGQQSVFNKEYVCLITLDIPTLTSEKLSSTRFMANGKMNAIKNYSGEMLIENIDFLLYSLDHEVFHCLDSYKNGSVYKKTFSQLESCFHQYLAELRADIYAGLTHRISKTNDSRFLEKMIKFRLLSLSEGDFTHYTVTGLREVSNLNIKLIPVDNLSNRFDFAMLQATKVDLSLNEFILFVVSTVYALSESGASQTIPQSIMQEIAEYSFMYNLEQIANITTEIKMTALIFPLSEK